MLISLCCVLFFQYGVVVTDQSVSNKVKFVIGPPEISSQNALFFPINDFADSLLKVLNSYLKNNNYDSIHLPNYNKTFKWGFFSGTTINLENGTLNNLNTIERSTDSMAHYSHPYLRFSIPMKSSKISIKYAYSAKIMGTKPMGVIIGNISNFQVALEVGMNLRNLQAKMFDFRVKSLTNTSLRFEGPNFMSSMINGISGMFVPTFEEYLPQEFDKFLQELASGTLEDYNNRVCKALEEC